MVKKQYKIPFDEDLYLEFKEFIRRDKGKIRGELSPAIEEALKLYMDVHRDPVTRSNIYDQLLRGRGGHPQEFEEKFYNDFKDRFMDYHLVGSGELNTWIKSFTGSHSETSLKKWRGRLRNKGLVVYNNNGLWIIPDNETTTQSTLPGSHEYIYSLLEPGKMVSYNWLKKISGLEEDPLRELIIKLEGDHKLENTTPGRWKVLEPEYF